MRKLALVAAVGTLVLASAPSALAGPNRADSYYYTVFCIDPSGNEVQAESVDAHAIDQGGKRHAIDLFNANHPDWSCEARGPFAS